MKLYPLATMLPCQTYLGYTYETQRGSITKRNLIK